LLNVVKLFVECIIIKITKFTKKLRNMVNFRKIKPKAFGITRAYVVMAFVARKRATGFIFARRAGYFSNFSNCNSYIS